MRGELEMSEIGSKEKWPSDEEIHRDDQRPGNPSRSDQGGYGGQGSDGVERQAGSEEKKPEQNAPPPGEQEGSGPVRRGD